ncbi:uncharacterized protein LOC134814411 isoform X3 [Bolinopsis microptera]|uniref:uncharacterized protein LOC134814411 isoform X3 n=1 Tax=Bolinopsis microptera TaxID=2820187 RepID=UPI003079EB15
MVKLIGRTSLRRSPKSEQAKKFLNKGASVLYVGSTDVCNPSSLEEMNSCITKVLEAPNLSDTKIFINSQDYLRVINAKSGKVIFCVPVDVIVNSIKAQEKYIVFSASTSINPNSNTISMAHVFECTTEKQVEDIYDALHRTIEAVRRRADLLEDVSKVAPLFSKLKLEKPFPNRDSNFVTYQSNLQSNMKMSVINNDRQAQEHKLAVTNHALFRNAFECMKQGNQERLHALIYSDLDILFADDAGQTLLHLSARIDKISMCKFLMNHCCTSDVERDCLRLAKDKEGMTALHLAAIYGLKNFVKFLAKDFNAVNIKDIKGRIPLHYCAGKIMHREMTHILVDHGSKIEEPEVNGVKPISIEPALSKIQELSVSGAFVFINSLNFLDRSGKRIDSGVDIACSEKTSSESEQDRLKPPHFGSYSSSQYEEDSSSYVGSSDSSPVSISDKMRHLREELSRMINLLMNPECHKYLLPQMCNEKTANKLIIIAQYPLLTDDCAQAIALLLHHLFRPTQDKSGHSIRKCVENGLLKTLVKLLDSHMTIQAQAISILEEVFSHNKGEKSEVDYISDFSELDPDLLVTLILENDLPMSNAKQKLVQNEMSYARRLRSLSSPSEIGDSFKSGNCYFTKNWSRRLLIRILSRTSLTKRMRNKMNTPRIVKELVELMNCPTMEIREHAVCALANMALSADNHDILLEHAIIKKFRDQVVDNHHVPVINYHCTRGLVYLGYSDEACQYVFEHNLKGQGIEEDRLWSNKNEMYNHPDHHFIRAATLEDIIVIMTSDPSLLWNSIPLRLSCKLENQNDMGVKDNEIIRFVLSLHRTFADTIVFFRLLVHRFSDPNVSPAKRYQQDIPPVHMKVCNVLCIWMEEFPYHFMEEPEMFNELEVFVVGLEDYGPVYYDLRDQIALKSQTVQIVDNGHTLDKVTHLDHYKHCRASLINEEFPLSVKTVSWLSALRGVIEKANLQEPPQSFFRSILSFKERELTTRLKAVIPPSYQAHPDVLTFTKNLYENLVTTNLSDREWQHLFVNAYFNHPLYKTELFYDLYLQMEDPAAKMPVIIGVNEHHFVVVDRFTNEIIGHHPLTNLEKPIQWFTKPFDNVLCVSMDQEYQIIGQNPSDIEILATLMIQHMGGKIEIIDNMFYVDDEDFSDSDRIVTNNRHSWHANTKNGYTRLEGDAPPTTPCGGNSFVDISQFLQANDDGVLSNARSRLSLNLSFIGQKAMQDSSSLRRVHTTNDVTIMNETLKLVESIPRTSLTDRLKSFSISTSITSRLDKLDSVRTEYDSDEDILPKVLPTDSLIGPPPPHSLMGPIQHSNKRSIRRSPRISPKQSWERGVVKIDPETAQETVIITEKCNVLYQLKTSGASTPSTPPDSAHTPHLRVRNMSSFKNIDTAAFTKLLAQSMEMIEERKRANRRNSTESAPIRKHSAGSSSTSTCKPRHHRPISRSKTFSQTFDKLVAASSPIIPAETPVELEKFSCLRENLTSCSLHRIRKAQNTLFSKKCDCPDVSHYTPCPCPPPVDLPYDFNFNYWRLDELNLLSHHREVARQLTLRDHELFANITENDILEYTKKRDLPISNYPSIHRCTEHFKKITDTVMTMILQCEPRDIRIKILENYIDITHQCVLLRNFSALFSIAFSALASAAIRNLASTWEGISPHHQQLFKQFLEITNPANNYKIFRKLLKTSNNPTVPFLQIYIGEFLTMNEVNPDYLKKGLINLQKRRLIYRELEEMRYFQNRKYNLTEIPDLISFFLNYETGQVDDFYLRSEILKRSEREKSKKSHRRRMTYS